MRKSVFVGIALSVWIVGVPAAALETISIDLDGKLRGEPFSEAVVAERATASLQGWSCEGALVTRNDASVHEGNVLIIRSGTTEVEIEAYEDSSEASTTRFGTVTLGESIIVSVRFGEDGVTSGDASILLECDQPPGEIIVSKAFDANGDGVADDLPADLESPGFGFTTTWGDSIQLRLGESATSGDLPPGTYGVLEVPTEFVADGYEWILTGATCSDGSDASAIELGAGEIITCTFTNTRVRVQGQVTTTTSPPTTTPSTSSTGPSSTTSSSVSPGTLPFTGSSDTSALAVVAAGSALLAGWALVIGANRSRSRE